MTVQLSPDAQRWVRAKWRKVRASQRAADEAADNWSALSASLNEKIALDQMARRRSGRILMTHLEITRMKGDNLALSEAISTHSWHAMEASRHLLDLQVYLQMKELGVDVS